VARRRRWRAPSAEGAPPWARLLTPLEDGSDADAEAEQLLYGLQKLRLHGKARGRQLLGAERELEPWRVSTRVTPGGS
jgi:hypothetical protein